MQTVEKENEEPFLYFKEDLTIKSVESKLIGLTKAVPSKRYRNWPDVVPLLEFNSKVEIFCREIDPEQLLEQGRRILRRKGLHFINYRDLDFNIECHETWFLRYKIEERRAGNYLVGSMSLKLWCANWEDKDRRWDWIKKDRLQKTLVGLTKKFLSQSELIRVFFLPEGGAVLTEREVPGL